MDSANDVHRAEARAAGILRLLMGMAMGASAMPPAGGMMLVQHLIVDGDGDMFSGGVGGGVPPASKAAIASLKEVKAEGAPPSDCAICLDAFDGGKEMPCGHRFHGECLERWLGVHGSCPVCRSELPKADPAAAEEEQDGDGERRAPRGAVLVSYLVMGGAEGPREEEQPMEEEPWNIRIEDVD